ncbi:hypothetical protein BSCG_04959 [Bacteroides sp. 2_2_4]|nr:hypothetical protein BSCG_04959 [Bacteroides sp. 2_2_4]
MYYPYFHSGFKQFSYFIWVTIQKYDNSANYVAKQKTCFHTYRTSRYKQDT